MPCSLSQFTQLLRKVPGISPEPPPSLKMLGPWENRQCSVTAWLGALGDSKMSLAILARLNCWETGLQKHRAGLACLGTTEVWVLRRPHSTSVNLSMAPQQKAPSSLDPDQEPRSYPSAQWNATPRLPCPCQPCPEPYIQLKSPQRHLPLNAPQVSHWDVETRGPVGDLRENDPS